MHSPKLLPTSTTAETFAGVTYHLDGELVPVLTVEITPARSIYFEHHILLWKYTTVNIGVKSLKGAFKRMFAGLPIFMTEATGTGQIAFSRDGAGHILPIHLGHNEELHVREHQFIAATDNISYAAEMVKGVTNILLGGNGFFIDKFRAEGGEGILWLHGYGNVFEVTLAAGEQIDVEPGAWLYKDPSVVQNVIVTKLSTGMFASQSFTMTRFTGPGRVGLQSMSVFTATDAATPTGAAGGSALGGLAGLAVGLMNK